MPAFKLDANTLEPARRKYLDGHDPVEAKKLLAEAGFARGLTVSLAHWRGYAVPWRNYYELTVDNLAQVGITAELKPEDQRRELDPARRREIVLDIQRYLADKAYYVYLPMWPRYITYPSYVKGFRNQDGASLGSGLLYTWFDR